MSVNSESDTHHWLRPLFNNAAARFGMAHTRKILAGTLLAGNLDLVFHHGLRFDLVSAAAATWIAGSLLVGLPKNETTGLRLNGACVLLGSAFMAAGLHGQNIPAILMDVAGAGVTFQKESRAFGDRLANNLQPFEAAIGQLMQYPLTVSAAVNSVALALLLKEALAAGNADAVGFGIYLAAMPILAALDRNVRLQILEWRGDLPATLQPL